MSHPYGSFSGRGSHSKRNEGDDGNGRAQTGTSSFKQHGRSGGRGHGPPAYLKGKEIGLYYRDKARARAKNARRCFVWLSSHTEKKIQSVLNKCHSFYEDTVHNTSARKAAYSSALLNKYAYIPDSQFKKKFLRIVSGNIQENLAKALHVQSSLQRDIDLDESLLEELTEKQTLPEYLKMTEFRQKLPAYQARIEVLELVKQNQVVLITGETGCGKTTQVAQFLLDDQIEQGNGSITRIACTQPRRISAISVAERVAAERAENLGKSVGFQIRLEKVLARDKGSILFCTTGMLLQFLQSDPALKSFSHIIMDEIHERSTESDFMLALLKLIIPKRPDLKVLLMSATLNAESFSKYFDNCPMIHIPGFTYPVEEFYLEDILMFTQFTFLATDAKRNVNYGRHRYEYKEMVQHREFSNMIEPYINKLSLEKKYPYYVLNELRNPVSEDLSLELIEKLISYICTTHGPGAILVFLPGMMDISKLNSLMLDSGKYPESRYIIYPLHSRMPTIDQKLVFGDTPEGQRKIILATSIAEASITIKDVVYVIDSGRVKLSGYDFKRNIQTLRPEWVSLANSKQRRGRAGRVKPGYCYYLYTKARAATFDQYPPPEMLRTTLEEVILQIKILQLGSAKSFLDSTMDPPDSAAVDVNLNVLRMLNALDEDEHLTPLGYHLAQLPLNPKTGKMIIWAALFSCVDPVFAIAASLTFKDAFYSPLGKQEEAMKKKLELSMGQYSDHIAVAEALRRFELSCRNGGARSFCKEYFLSFNTLKLLSDMKRQFAQQLCEMQFLQSGNPRDRNANRNSDNIALIKAIVCAGLYPNIAVVSKVVKSGIFVHTLDENVANIHPSSVNGKVSSLPSSFITYFVMQYSTAIYLHDTTNVSAPMLLFATPKITIEHTDEDGQYALKLDTSQTFLCSKRTAYLIKKLQEEFNKFLEYKITQPSTVCWSSHEGDLLNIIIDVIGQEQTDMR